MSATPQAPPKAAAELEAQLRAGPIIQWLIAQRLYRTRTTLLFDGLCRQLREAGIPISRSSLAMPQLHPQLRASTMVWEADAGGAIEVGRAHGIEETSGYLKSPVRAIYEGAGPIRRRLADPDCPEDFPIVADLRAKGLTDYIMLPLVFSTRRINAFSCASDAPAGFSDQDLAVIDAILPAFGAILELRHVHRTARQLMETYIGRQTGHRVLSGRIQRGDVTSINAVLWTCDLRHFTEISEQHPMEELIRILNLYFEIMGQPVEEAGGEILKFIGDAILAIFPIEEAKEGDACRACQDAMAAACEALNQVSDAQVSRQKEGKPSFRCGVALHVGDVMYGNIGAADRLDFTVIGPAVNLVCRIEGLNRDLAMPLVYSSEFAALWDGRSRSLGFHALKGIAEAQEVFTLAEPG